MKSKIRIKVGIENVPRAFMGPRAYVSKLALLGFGLAALFVVVGCGSSSSSSSSADVSGSGSGGGATTAASVAEPNSLLSAGHLTFCSDVSYPPVEYFEEGSQTPVGSDIDLGTAIAETMGLEASFLNTGFEGLIAAVEGGKCDAIMSGMDATPEREKVVSFTKYTQTGEYLVVQKGDPAEFKNLKDLSGLTVGAELATTEVETMKEANKELEAEGKAPINIVTFPKDTDLAAALSTGKIEVWFDDAPPIGYIMSEQPEAFRIASPQMYVNPVGIAVNKDNTELLEALSAAIKKLYADGTAPKILKKWKMGYAILQGGYGELYCASSC